MPKSQAAYKYKYKLRFTVDELKEKHYRKYLYPQEIDGITFFDDVERKLSESSWFRCLTPTQQLALEKEIRLRVEGTFNKPILHYEDSINESALGISKPILLRLTDSLTASELQFFFRLLPYIHINDGMLRNKSRDYLTGQNVMEICKVTRKDMKKTLVELDKKGIILVAKAPLVPENKDDVYLPLSKRLPKAGVRCMDEAKDLLIYVNPFIVFFEQFIDKLVMPYFANTGWYVLNPYADRIKDWIEMNCK